MRRSYPESVVFPIPGVRVASRSSAAMPGALRKAVQPEYRPRILLRRAQFSPRYEAFEVAYNGNPAHRVDIVLLPEGYGAGGAGEIRIGLP